MVKVRSKAERSAYIEACVLFVSSSFHAFHLQLADILLHPPLAGEYADASGVLRRAIKELNFARKHVYDEEAERKSLLHVKVRCHSTLSNTCKGLC